MTPIGKFAKLLLALTIGAAVAYGMAGCTKKEEPGPAAPATKAPPALGQVTAPDGSRLLELRVTQEGYEPSPVNLERGKPVTLQVTRTTDRTCATEFILDEHGIDEKLPLNETVTIRFTPDKDGELVFGCGMDKMISGRFIVR